MTTMQATRLESIARLLQTSTSSSVNFEAICDLDVDAFVRLAIDEVSQMDAESVRAMELSLHTMLHLEPAFCVLLGACRLERGKFESAHRAFCAALHDLRAEQTKLRQYAQLGRARATLKLGRPFWASVDLQSAQHGPCEELSEQARKLDHRMQTDLRVMPLRLDSTLMRAAHRRVSSVARVQVQTVA